MQISMHISHGTEANATSQTHNRISHLEQNVRNVGNIDVIWLSARRPHDGWPATRTRTL